MALHIHASSGNITTTRNRKKRKHKKRTSTKVLSIFLLLTITFIACLLTPFFNIMSINVTGNEKVSSESIIAASAIDTGVNIFKVNFSKIKANIMDNPYIKEVEVKRHIPNKIIVDVKERKAAGYLQFMGAYIYIDETGYVIEVASHLEPDALPIILGLKFNQFKTGETIQVDDIKKLDAVVLCVKEIINNDLLNKVSQIDANDIDNIHIKIDNKIETNLGDNSNMNYKISYLNSVLNELDQYEEGYINLDNVVSQGKATFTYDK